MRVQVDRETIVLQRVIEYLMLLPLNTQVAQTPGLLQCFVFAPAGGMRAPKFCRTNPGTTVGVVTQAYLGTSYEISTEEVVIKLRSCAPTGHLRSETILPEVCMAATPCVTACHP